LDAHKPGLQQVEFPKLPFGLRKYSLNVKVHGWVYVKLHAFWT